MKKLLYLVLFLSFSVFSQEYTSRDGVPLGQIQSKYIIIEKAKVFNKKTVILLDYGQELKTGFNVNAIRINGKKAKFSSLLNVVNLLTNYEVVQFITDINSNFIMLKYIAPE